MAASRVGESGIRHCLRGFFDAWLARNCAVCSLDLKTSETGICAGCIASLPGASSLRCSICGLKLPPTSQTGSMSGDHSTERICAACRIRPPAFDQSIVLADYAAPRDRLIQALKFGHQLALADALGNLLAQRLPPCKATLPTVLTAVPLAPKRLASRGFNQSERMAREIARVHRVRLFIRGVTRLRDTPAQSALPLASRLSNLAGAFGVDPVFAGARVILVDDVMTSGATLQELACALKKAGASEVINLVVARTP